MQGEQYSRSFNVELKEILEHNNEDPAKIIAEADRAVGEPIEHADREMCHRGPVLRSGAKNVIVQVDRLPK